MSEGSVLAALDGALRDAGWRRIRGDGAEAVYDKHDDRLVIVMTDLGTATVRYRPDGGTR